MDGWIDLGTASPTEYLRYLQLLAAQQRPPRGRRSTDIGEALRDKAVLEARLKQDVATIIEASGLEGEEREKLRATLLENSEDVLAVQVPTGVMGNPAFYVILTRLVRNVEQAVAALGYEVPEEVTFGALPTGQINGLACAVPAGGLIVALDDGVFTFFSLVAKTVATFYKMEHTSDGGGAITLIDSDIPRAVATSQEGNRRWLEALTATFDYDHPDLAPLWPSPEERNLIVDASLTPAEMFIVAHEFAHLILGHYDRQRPTYRRRMSGGVQFENLETLREDELEADRLALEILREHYGQAGAPVEHTRWAVYFLHGCLNTLALDRRAGVPTEASTHPTAKERSERLLQQLAEVEGAAAEATPFSSSVYEVMRHLFFHNLDRYLEWRELANNGTVPWSITPRPTRS